MDPREIAAETSTERESSKLMDAIDLAEETEESGDESEEESEEERTERLLGPYPRWDVDSFDGRDYDSSEDVSEFSEKEKYKDELCREFKRQIIKSKGFYVPTELIPWSLYSRIKVIRNLDKYGGWGLSYRQFFEEMVRICLKTYNEEKSGINGFNVEFVEIVRAYYKHGERSKAYITFKAKEKPDGADVEYQAKAWTSYQREIYPILCRPAPPMAKTSKQN